MTEGATDISFEGMSEAQQKVAAIIQQDPAITAVMSSVGAGGLSTTANVGRIFITLKAQKDRPISATTGRPEHAMR